MTASVDTNIPFGNACNVTAVERAECTEVRFSADPHGGPESLWFCFRVCRDDTADIRRPLRLVLEHGNTMLGIDKAEHVLPVVRHAGGDWERLPPGQTEPLPDGRTDMFWTFMPTGRCVEIALCYPYGTSDLDALVQQSEGALRSDAIGVSQAGRPIVRVSNDYGSAGRSDRRRGVYVIARQHSGETPGSWVLDGFLRRIASLGDQAPLVWSVPLSNIDGVEGGDYGKDNFPFDLNRAWGTPPMRHEILVIKADVALWRTRSDPVLGLDLHAPGGCETSGIYAFVPDPEALPEEHGLARAWSDPLQNALSPEYADREFSRHITYKSRWETPSFNACMTTEHGVPGLTIETPYAMVRDLALTQSHYRDAGARIADAISDKTATV